MKYIKIFGLLIISFGLLYTCQNSKESKGIIPDGVKNIDVGKCYEY